MTADLDALVAELTAIATTKATSPETVGNVVWRALCARLLGGLVESQRLDDWFGTGLTLPDASTQNVEATPAELCAAFERTSSLRSSSATTKRDKGVYYTPRSMAALVVSATLAALGEHPDDVLTWRILDPAAGAGAFGAEVVEGVTSLLRAGGLDQAAARDHALTRTIHLVDADPLAVAVARSLLVAEFGSPSTDLKALEQNVRCGDAIVGGPDPHHSSGFQWSTVFAEVVIDGGFHAVVGNPPWGAVKPSLREVAAGVDPALLRLDTVSLRERFPTPVDQSQREYSAALRSAGYRAQGVGDTEMYRYFVELAYGLVRRGGVIGLLVPSALQRAAGAAPLRRLLLDHGEVEIWLDFLNSRGLFAIHKMFRFSMVVWRQGGEGGIRQVRFGLRSVEEAREALLARPLSLSRDFLRTVSPTRLTIPDVRSRGEAALYGRLHQAHPALGDLHAGSWSVRFRRELDMTNDAGSFRTVADVRHDGAVPRLDGTWLHPEHGELLPVFEGRMLNQHDPAAKAHLSGHGRGARWELLAGPAKRVRSRFLIAAAEAERRGVRRAIRAAFCDITGHANERTILAALVPASAACGNKVPTCEFSTDHPDLPRLWTSIANSFVLDWIARRRVSTTLNFFHWEELPFPRLDPDGAVAGRLAHAAAELAGQPGRPWAGSAARRAELRTIIDVEVALQFDLGLEDLVVMLSDFPLLDRGTVVGHRMVTRDLVLSGVAARRGVDPALHELGLPTDGGPSRLSERPVWHAAAGAIGYVPGKLAG